mmetsp:Transcript_22285/g.40144  ORF Transcript_22285/g.40144 Transcript_22285/m.40144 type:complete len:388 (-) Transcript_22285:140-1303(-)|eukprot:CAMPEP_0197658264 /NCGR_PEP_ID=MMETSP1338-20131121/45134_1 /TAXON_ID=43686 ORGANISM="Pelagodinium beii, Strain RCC1491" /NCGR_SAMPLE_ID=MMETSP1338 /ASSEMBLY_ACC=CAM_ASM_000754 /LENGTH=387 /DNA_ID=CAMNT_0043234821 /DNA_START=71 /DNA_END=1234 /DNA_ORIENTATION=+
MPADSLRSGQSVAAATGRASRSFLFSGNENLNPASTCGAEVRLGALGTGSLPSGRFHKTGAPGPRHFGGDLTNVPDGHRALKSGSCRKLPAQCGLSLNLNTSRQSDSTVGRTPFLEESTTVPRKDRMSEPQCVSEYMPEIIADLYKKQAAYLPRPDFLESQPEINGKMRAILVDWLVEVHSSLKLRAETLYLTVRVLDCYLSATAVPRKQFQLIGITALLLASKFEEIDPPKIRKLIWISDNSYTKKEVLTMECAMLKSLSFGLMVPTQVHFLDYLLSANGCDGPRHECLVHYFLELALVEGKMAKFLPSVLVSAALHFSNEVLGRRVVWSEKMSEISTLGEAELQDCVREMHALLKAVPTGKQQAVRKKYLKEKYHFVASIPVPGN